MKEIIEADALEWMATTKKRGAVITGIPDLDEIGNTSEQWNGDYDGYIRFFKRGAEGAFGITGDTAPIVFYQTDRKVNKTTISKASILFNLGARLGFKLLWHKIVMRRRVGKIDRFRPGYSHLIAFSKSAGPGQATPDLLECGKRVYENGFPINVARFAVEFCSERDPLVIDPFCGRGTIPAVAEALGVNTIGVDIDPKQCFKARRLRVAPLASRRSEASLDSISNF
jgi:hypothetical protein